MIGRWYLLPAMLLLGLVARAGNAPTPPPKDYRAAMRTFVEGISAYARAKAPGFLVIPQNGQELLTLDGKADGPWAKDYAAAIDGQGREDLFYGYSKDGVKSPSDVTAEWTAMLDRARKGGLPVLAIDYCSKHTAMDDANHQCLAHDYLPFAADQRELNDVPAYPPAPVRANADDVKTLAQARNFLFLIDPDKYKTKAAFLAALQQTDYDTLIVDAEYDGQPLTREDVATLKQKAHGGARLVIAYMSIGEAEDYRWYWQPAWKAQPPAWLEAEDPDWPGDYKVRYWDPAWQAIIYGNDASYTKKLLDAGFDGAYLDLVDSFEYFEDKNP